MRATHVPQHLSVGDMGSSADDQPGTGTEIVSDSGWLYTK